MNILFVSLIIILDLLDRLILTGLYFFSVRIKVHFDRVCHFFRQFLLLEKSSKLVAANLFEPSVLK